MGGCSVVYPPGYVPGNLIVVNTTVLNASQIGDDVVGPVDTLAIYCDTTIGSTANRRTVAHYGGTIEYLAAAEEFKVDARTVVHTGTEGALEVELTTGTATGVKGIKVDMVTGNLINGAWAYGFYADMNVTAAATATSNAADLYLATPVGDTANVVTYGLYIEAGFDFGLAILSPVKLSSLIIAPTADPTPYPLDFQLEGWPTANVYSQGRVINMDYGAARTLDGALYGMYMDFRTNLTLGGQTVTGVYVDIGTTGTANPGIGMTVVKSTTNNTGGAGTVSGSVIGLNITSAATGGAGCTVIDGTVGIGIAITASDAGGGEVMTVENIPLAITYVSAGGTPVLGDAFVISATIPAGFIVSGASTVRGLYMAFSPELSNAGANLYGIHIDTSGVTETLAAANYGVFVQMPAAYAATSEAAVYATGKGNQLGLLQMTYGVYLNVLTTGITTGIGLDLEVMPTGTVINVAYSVAETLTGALTGITMDLSTNVTPADQIIIAYDITLPINVAAASAGVKVTTTMDQGTAFLADINSTVAGGQTVTALSVDCAGLDSSAATFYGINLAMSGATVGLGTYGIYGNLNPSQRAGMYLIFTASDTNIVAYPIKIDRTTGEVAAGAPMTISSPSIYLDDTFISGVQDMTWDGGIIWARVALSDTGVGVLTQSGNLIDIQVTAGIGTPEVQGNFIYVRYDGTQRIMGDMGFFHISSAIEAGNSLAAADVRGMYIGYTGAFTQAVSNSNFYGVYIDFSSNVGTGGGGHGGTFVGFNFMSTASTINAPLAVLRGSVVDLTGFTLTSVATAYGHNIVLPAATTTGIYLSCDSVSTAVVNSGLIGFSYSANAAAASVAVGGNLISGTYTMLNTAPFNNVNAQDIMDITYVMTRDAAATMSWAGSFLNLTITPTNTPTVSGQKIAQTYGAVGVTAALNLTGYYLSSSAIINDGGAANATHYGAHYNLSGVTTTVAGAANMLALYGLYIQMPATGNVYGANKSAAIYATGNGNIFSALIGHGVYLNMGEVGARGIYVVASTDDANNTKTGLYQDMNETGTTGTFSGNHIYLRTLFNADPANTITWTGSFMNAQIDGTTAARDLIGATSAINIQTTVNLTYSANFAMATLNSDALHDGAAADTLLGIDISWSGAMPQTAANANFYGIRVDYSATLGTGAGGNGGMVAGFYYAPTGIINAPLATVRGSEINLSNMTLTSVATAYANSIILPATKATGIYMVCDSVDAVANSTLIGFQFSANANGVTIAPTADIINGTVTLLNTSPFNMTWSGSLMDISYVLTRDPAAGARMTWSGSVISFAVTPTNSPFMTGNKISQTYGATTIPDAGTFRGYYLEADASIGESVAANAVNYGIHIDYSGCTSGAAVAAWFATFYGMSIQMPAAGNNVWGGGKTAAVNMTGNGYTIGLIYDYGVANSYGMYMAVPAAAAFRGLYIDGATNAQIEKNLIYVPVNCAAITGVAYFRAMYFDINETVVGNDGSFIVGQQIDMTGFALGRADLTALKIFFDGTKSSALADVTHGIYIDSDLTLNDATELFYGIGIDLSGMTLTAFSMAAAIKVEGTGPVGAWDFISAGTQAAPLRQTAATGNRFIEIVVQQETNALAGATLRGLACRTSVAVDSATGNIYSGEFQALNTDGTDIGVLTGVYIGVMGKGATLADTIGYMRGMEVVLTKEVIDTITNLRGLEVTIRTRDDGIAIGSSYGIRVANEAVVGVGENLDAAIYAYTDVSEGFDYGVDLSGCASQFGVGDIRLGGIFGALDVAAVGNRGTIALMRGAAGVRDSVWACLKDDADAYAWVEIADEVSRGQPHFEDHMWAGELSTVWATRVTTGAVTKSNRINGWVTFTTGAVAGNQESVDWDDDFNFESERRPTFEVRVDLAQIDNDTEVYIGLVDTNVAADYEAPATGSLVMFQIDNGAHGSQNWFLIVSNGGGAAVTKRDTGIAGSVNEIVLKFVYVSDTIVEVFVDGVSKGTCASNVPAGDALQPVISIRTALGGGAAAKAMSVDFTKIGQDQT